METGDIIKQTMISEVDGVVISNTFYYVVKDATLTGTINDLAKQIHADWWSRLVLAMSDAVATTCTIWENLNGNDPTFAEFVTLAGAHLVDNMPADNVVLVTRKAVGPSGIVHGTIALSGFAEVLHPDGHTLDYETAAGLISWLTEDQVYNTTVIRNVQPHALLPSGFQYPEVTHAEENAHIKKRPRRRSRLCKSA